MRIFHRQPSTTTLHLLYLLNHKSPIHVMARLFLVNGFSSKCTYVIVYIWWGIPKGLFHMAMRCVYFWQRINQIGRESIQAMIPQDPCILQNGFDLEITRQIFPAPCRYTFESYQEILVKKFPIHCHVCLGRSGYYSTSIGFFTLRVQSDIVAFEGITALDLRIVCKFYSPYLAFNHNIRFNIYDRRKWYIDHTICMRIHKQHTKEWMATPNMCLKTSRSLDLCIRNQITDWHPASHNQNRYHLNETYDFSYMNGGVAPGCAPLNTQWRQ